MRHQPGETFPPCPVEEKRERFLTEVLAEVFDIHECQFARRQIQASTQWECDSAPGITPSIF